MKHAGEETLGRLGDLLARLRQIPRLKERKTGTFYLSGSAFLHFHEDQQGIFADLKVAGTWQRFEATSSTQQEELLRRAREAAETA